MFIYVVIIFMNQRELCYYSNKSNFNKDKMNLQIYLETKIALKNVKLFI